MADGYSNAKRMVATLERPTPATATVWWATCTECGKLSRRRTKQQADEDGVGHRDKVTCTGTVWLTGHYDTWFGKGAKKRG